MSAGAGAAAAAAAAELMRREEEEMTGYSDRDLTEHWEFKIVRSNMGAFRKTEFLRTVLEEEKRGGWVLVEKFDNGRIRLKRPAGTKGVEGDFSDGYDPYRSHVGVTDGRLAATIFCVIAGSLVGFFLIFAILAKAFN